jgi:hypothetical protein
MATKARGRPKKIKQTVLKEMEPTRNSAIDKAAEAYVEARDERMELTKQETATKAVLMAAMKEAGESIYETEDGLVVEITHKDVEDVKVKRRGADED